MTSIYPTPTIIYLCSHSSIFHHDIYSNIIECNHIELFHKVIMILCNSLNFLIAKVSYNLNLHLIFIILASLRYYFFISHSYPLYLAMANFLSLNILQHIVNFIYHLFLILLYLHEHIYWRILMCRSWKNSTY